MHSSSQVGGSVVDVPRRDSGRLSGRRLRHLLVALVAAAALGSLAAPGEASASCIPRSGDTAVAPARPQCIANVEIRARGWINPACLAYEPIQFQIYPSYSACGGGVKKGPEMIAHSRVLTKLGHVAGGIRSGTQWEHQLQTSDGRGRADISDESADWLDVYEVKLYDSRDYPGVVSQVTGYVNAINALGPSPRARRGESARLAGWADAFMAPDKNWNCTTSAGTAGVRFSVYTSWVSEPGVITVFHYPVPCVDPREEPPRPPAEVPVPVPVFPEPLPVQTWPVVPWEPFPGTQIPTPANPPGGGPDPHTGQPARGPDPSPRAGAAGRRPEPAFPPVPEPEPRTA